MQTELFKTYKIADLIDILAAQIKRLEDKDVNSPAAIKRRLEATSVLTQYKFFENGKPVPVTLNDEERASLTDIVVPGDLRPLLGLDSSTIPLRELQRIAADEATLPTPENARKLVAAHSLLEIGQRKQERLQAKIAEIASNPDTRTAFEAADAAYKRLTSIRALTDDEKTRIMKGKMSITALERQQRSEEEILLSLDEYLALRDLTLDQEMIRATANDEQPSRRRINACIPEINNNLENGGQPNAKAYYDPKKMARIESLLRLDMLGDWLLNEAKDAGLPVILCRYLAPDFILDTMNGLCLAYYYSLHGTYTNTETGYKTGLIKYRDFIVIHSNKWTEAELAASYGHELRHFWQSETMRRSEIATFSSVDKILHSLLCEADAQAIGNKIGVSIYKKQSEGGKRPGLSLTDNMLELSNTYNRLIKDGATPQTATRKSTQGAFISFLRQELANPAYISTYVAELRPENRAILATASQNLDRSRVLTNSFLARISKVGGVHYIDEEGAAEIRKLLSEKLPAVLAQAASVQSKQPRFG